VEVLRDVGFRLAPLTKAEALRLVRSVKGFALLDGARGRPPADLETIADALVALSRFAEAHPQAASVEINPFIALPQGGYGVDAVILRD
jgi:acyl-CoA synthetase (NDP forming)